MPFFKAFSAFEEQQGLPFLNQYQNTVRSSRVIDGLDHYNRIVVYGEDTGPSQRVLKAQLGTEANNYYFTELLAYTPATGYTVLGDACVCGGRYVDANEFAFTFCVDSTTTDARTLMLGVYSGSAFTYYTIATGTQTSLGPGAALLGPRDGYTDSTAYVHATIAYTAFDGTAANIKRSHFNLDTLEFDETTRPSKWIVSDAVLRSKLNLQQIPTMQSDPTCGEADPVEPWIVWMQEYTDGKVYPAEALWDTGTAEFVATRIADGAMDFNIQNIWAMTFLDGGVDTYFHLFLEQNDAGSSSYGLVYTGRAERAGSWSAAVFLEDGESADLRLVRMGSRPNPIPYERLVLAVDPVACKLYGWLVETDGVEFFSTGRINLWEEDAVDYTIRSGNVFESLPGKERFAFIVVAVEDNAQNTFSWADSPGALYPDDDSYYYTPSDETNFGTGRVACMRRLNSTLVSYTVDSSFTLLKSEDGGATWAPVTTPWYYRQFDDAYPMHVVADRSGVLHVFGIELGTGDLWHYWTRNLETWQSEQDYLTAGLVPYAAVASRDKTEVNLICNDAANTKIVHARLNGSTWTETDVVDLAIDISSGALERFLTVDADAVGGLHVVYVGSTTAYVRMDPDYTWGTPVNLINEAGGEAGSAVDIAARPDGAAEIALIVTDTGNSFVRVIAKTVADSFSSEDITETDGTTYAMAPVVTVDSLGVRYVYYAKFPTATADPTYGYIASDDGGGWAHTKLFTKRGRGTDVLRNIPEGMFILCAGDGGGLTFSKSPGAVLPLPMGVVETSQRLIPTLDHAISLRLDGTSDPLSNPTSSLFPARSLTPVYKKLQVKNELAVGDCSLVTITAIDPTRVSGEVGLCVAVGGDDLTDAVGYTYTTSIQLTDLGAGEEQAIWVKWTPANPPSLSTSEINLQIEAY